MHTFVGKDCGEDVKECKSSPCYNGGTCTEPNSPGFHCQCAENIHGNQCQIVTIATFDGNSLVSLPGLTTNEMRRKRSIERSGFSVGPPVAKDSASWRKKRNTPQIIGLKLTFQTTIGDGSLIIASGVTSSYEYLGSSCEFG